MLVSIQQPRIKLEVDLRAILGLGANFVKDSKLNAFTGKTLNGLLHGIKLGHIGIGDNAHALCGEVGKVHSDLLGRAGSEANARCRHLEGILLLARGIHRCGHAALYMVEQRWGLLVVVVVVGVLVAWAVGWVSVLYCA